MDHSKVVLTAQRMTKARTALVIDNPFFGNLAMRLQLSCAPCGTACTDGEKLIMDPEFAERLKTEQELQFVMLHEILHCVLDHCTRGRPLNQLLFNIACDIVVNSTILGMWGMKTFRLADETPMHTAPDGSEGRGHNAEEIYHMLLEKYRDSLPPADAGMQTIDRHDIWNSIKDTARIRDAWGQNILAAAKYASGDAKMPQSVRIVKERLEKRSKVNWKQLLHDFIQHDQFDYSFLPPDRRFSDSDFYLPAFNIDTDNGNADDVWVCVDTSASISDDELADALGEVYDAICQTGLSGTISFFDSDITDPAPFASADELLRIKPSGGGGTNFHIIFEYMKERLYPELPKAILIFTDGYAPWPKESDAMDVPVLWLICKGGNSGVPWGRAVEL